MPCYGQLIQTQFKIQPFKMALILVFVQRGRTFQLRALMYRCHDTFNVPSKRRRESLDNFFLHHTNCVKCQCDVRTISLAQTAYETDSRPSGQKNFAVFLEPEYLLNGTHNFKIGNLFSQQYDTGPNHKLVKFNPHFLSSMIQFNIIVKPRTGHVLIPNHSVQPIPANHAILCCAFSV